MAKKWFTMKHHGWGWVPITWEGWAVIGVMSVVIIIAAMKLEDGLMTQKTFTFWMVGSVVAMIFIAYKKGPWPRWRWDKN